MKKLGSVLVLALCVAASSWSASAHAVAFGDATAKDRATLQAQVASTRAASPKSFAQLRALRTQLPELDQKKRGRVVVIVPSLVALGVDGLLPMLDALMLTADAHHDLSDQAFATWRAGLVEAVGRLRDERALPHLKSILGSGSHESATTRVAAGRAIGQLRSETAISALTSAASDANAREAAVVGLGEARRVIATAYLASVLEGERQDTPLLRASLKALGQAGSSWAWDTLGGATTGEGDQVRQLAAKALLEAWMRLAGEAREEAVVAMSMTEYRELPTMIAALKGNKGADVEAISRLHARVQRLKLR